MLYVANLAPSTHEENRFYAFGRVFSGTLVAGQQVRILGPDDRPGQKVSPLSLGSFFSESERVPPGGLLVASILCVGCL
jgi:translation elongation factor EF-G